MSGPEKCPDCALAHEAAEFWRRDAEAGWAAYTAAIEDQVQRTVANERGRNS